MTDTETTGSKLGELSTTLPPYRLRRSKRARYLRVTVTPQEGVTVILPVGVAKQQVSPFLQTHRVWLWQQLNMANAALAGTERGQLPDSIDLAAIGQVYSLVYQSADHQRLKLRKQGSQLLISGTAFECRAVCELLRDWLKREARAFLLPRLTSLAQQHDFQFQKLSVRLQRSRWGSCSGRGQINLNAKLLFLPLDLLDYVLLHELAHTRHRNHSAQFWQLLSRLVADVGACHSGLREAGGKIPWWVEADFNYHF